MPRHRKDGVPRRSMLRHGVSRNSTHGAPRHGPPGHGAQRLAEGPGRGVPAEAAGPTSRLLGGRSVRSLFVTPWFAAGLGVLITATLVLESPTDAVLSYRPPGGSPCAAPGCVSTGSRHGHGSLASQRGSQLKQGTRANTGDGGRPARHGSAGQPASHTSPAVAVSYRMLSRNHHGFIAMITLSSPASLGDWTLGFTIPGASIRGVGGAAWRSDGGDSGTAQAQSSPWLRSRSRSGAGMARFMVFGTGLPGQPTGCTFDGRTCAFS